MKTVTVTVSGRAGSGKTMISREIANHLASLGISVVVAPDLDGHDTPELHVERMADIRAVSELLTVEVNTMQLRRLD